MESGELVGGRYLLVGEIGRGGMGVVYRAIDTSLGRPLAVKVMADGLPPGGYLEARFLEEARITGQLQHPGIAPVHEVGRLANQQPYFAMKLIEGRTLAELLKERPSPQAGLPEMLKIFEQVSQTLAYAHAQDVIHRDLKPANVMVGAFGEVQVMDWGLAKRLGSPSTAAGDDLALASSRDGPCAARPAELAPTPLTLAGQVLGTPAYMPPEQASGDLDAADKRSDVFGLGAMLLVILTGAPPYRGSRPLDLLELAAQADLADARQRLDACGADESLIVLARDCLAAEADRRPSDAGVVAQRMTSYLASVQERLRFAEMQRAAEAARAAEKRKRRRVTAALAVCALLLVSGAAVALVTSYQRQARTNAKRMEAERDAAAALEASSAELEALRSQFADPIACRAICDTPLRWQAALASVQSGLTRSGDLLAAAPPGTAPALASRLDALRARLAATERACGLAQRLDEIRMADSVLVQGRWTHVAVIPRYLAAFRDAGLNVQDNSAASVENQRSSTMRWPLVAALDHWAAVARDEGPAEVERLLRLARRLDPHPWRDRFRNPAVWQDLAALGDLAADPRTLRQSPQFIEALAWVYSNQGGDAGPLLRRALARYPRDYWLLFRSSLIAADPQERAGFLRAALVIRPASSAAHNNLGNALSDLGRLDAAEASFREALRLDPRSAYVHFNLGLVLSAQKKCKRAARYYQRALELEPDRSLAAMAHTSLGLDLVEQDQLDEGQAHYQKALALDPNYALAHMNLGLVHRRRGRLAEAVACHRRALALDPRLALAHLNLGAVLRQQGQLDEAVACYQQAIALDERLARAHDNLGVVFRQQGRLDEALACHHRALDHAPNDPQAHLHLGLALKDQGRIDAAIASLQRALALDPGLADACLSLGNIFYQRQELAKALDCFRKLVDLCPHEAVGHLQLGKVLFDSGRVEESVRCYHLALKLDADNASAYYHLALARHAQGLKDDCIAAYQQAIRLDPQHADAQRNLGLLHKSEGRFAEALPLLTRAQELGAQSPGWLDPQGESVRHCARMLDADNKLPAVLKGELEPTSGAELLDLADLCRAYKKRRVAAVRFYRQAFAAEAALAEAPAAARYNAACAALLAATGCGEDSDELDQAERARLRQQALEWLAAELGTYRKLLQEGSAADHQRVRLMTSHLPNDADLASVRPPASGVLPTDEQAQWRQFWSDVAEVASLAGAKTAQ